MWPFRTTRHSRYNSIEAWIAGERIPLMSNVTDEKERDRLFSQLAELHAHLWERHFRKLPEAERMLLREQQHPSQSHKLSAGAVPYAEALRLELLSASIPVHKVAIGLYHCDRIVLSVLFISDADLEAERHKVPMFYSGFEIKLGTART